MDVGTRARNNDNAICVVFSTRAQCRFIISCITCVDEVESPLHLCRGRLEAWTRDNIGRICGVPQDKNPLRARKHDTPVTLPPGRERDCTRPVATASPLDAMTIGVFVVTRFAAATVGVPHAT